MQGKAWAALLAALIITLSAPAVPGTAAAEQGPLLFSACASPDLMTVHIYSEPPEANLRVDRAPVGQTPAKLCLPAGSHTLRLSRAGYQNWTRTVETLPGSEVLLRAELERGRTEEEKDRFYRRGAATVWALEELEDDKSCIEAKERYQRKQGGLPPLVREAIETTYVDLMGACDSNDPPRAAREKARRYLLD